MLYPAETYGELRMPLSKVTVPVPVFLIVAVWGALLLPTGT